MNSKVNLLVVSLSLASSIGLTGCDSRQKLKVFNWGEYIDMKVIKSFEKENNVHVVYSKYDSNEIAYTKMETQTYDIVFPSEYMIEQLAIEGKIKELDWSRISNFNKETDLSIQASAVIDNLTNPKSDKLGSFDFLKYAAPYLTGQVGLVYNTEKEGLTAAIQAKGWEILKDPKYRVAYYNSSRDGFLVPLSQLGYDSNTTDTKEINEAKEWLLDQKRVMGRQLTYMTDQILDEMTSGKYDVGLVYSGDANYIITNSEYKLAFFRPQDKMTNQFLDGMVIPAKSTQDDLAYKFISHMMSYESVLANSRYVGYTSGRKDVVDFLVENDYKDIKDSYAFTNNPLDTVYRFVPENKRQLDTNWTEVKTA
jgi:spermidine/putrescine-binding protein